MYGLYRSIPPDAAAPGTQQQDPDDEAEEYTAAGVGFWCDDICREDPYSSSAQYQEEEPAQQQVTGTTTTTDFSREAVMRALAYPTTDPSIGYVSESSKSGYDSGPSSSANASDQGSFGEEVGCEQMMTESHYADEEKVKGEVEKRQIGNNNNRDEKKGDQPRNRRRLWILLGALVLLIAIIVAIVVPITLTSVTKDTEEKISDISDSNELINPSPTSNPSLEPVNGVVPSAKPVNDDVQPSQQPVKDADEPSSKPDTDAIPSLQPVSDDSPTSQPTIQPPVTTASPTSQPTIQPVMIPTAAPRSETEEFLRQVALGGGDEFDDPDSYQTAALQFLERYPGQPRGNVPQELTFENRTLQRYALTCIYYATNNVSNAYTKNAYTNQNQNLKQPSPSWTSETGWLRNNDECTWHGINCTDDGRVTVINLSNNSLTGSFPPEVVYLRDTLTVLDLSNNFNYNTGEAGNNFLGELTRLKKLYYGKTPFRYDGIPPAIGNLTNLVEYDASYTLYFGPLRASVFENLNKLEVLMLSGNSYSSPMPDTLGQLPNLRDVHIKYADLTGDLSFLAAGWPAIYELRIDRNPQLSGSMPSNIGSLTTLGSLGMSSCNLDGTLPESLGNLTNMRQLLLFNNSLRGEIPSSLGKLTAMQRLELEGNDLSGTMPQVICYNRLAQLKVLTADCGGEIPEVSCPLNCCTCCGEQCAGVDGGGS